MPRTDAFRSAPIPVYGDEPILLLPRAVERIDETSDFPIVAKLPEILANRPPAGTDPTDPTNQPPNRKDDIDRVADILKDLFSQRIEIPAVGSPVVIPQQTTSTSIIPVLLILSGIGGLAAYVYYRRKKAD